MVLGQEDEYNPNTWLSSPNPRTNLKDKKRYKAVNGYYKKHTAQKSRYYKIWKK
jgi:hypothetical protein